MVTYLPVTAAANATDIIATIILDLVAVIAAFKAGVDDFIAAARYQTSVGAGIGGDLVAIIAALKALLAFL